MMGAKTKLLTKERLKELTFRMVVHLNGGSNYSAFVRVNDEFGLTYRTRTDGSPDYKVTDRSISDDEGGHVLDMMCDLSSRHFEKAMEEFVAAYNEGVTEQPGSGATNYSPGAMQRIVDGAVSTEAPGGDNHPEREEGDDE